MTRDPGTLRADYEALRHDVGGRLVARDVIAVRGPDAASYLQGQLSQDVAALDEGSATESLLLSPQGKLDAYLRVTRWRDDAFVLDVDGGFADAVVARLQRFKLRVKADIEVLPWACISLRGPLADDVGASGVELRLPVTWGSVSGVDLLGPDVEIPDGIPECGLDAWEAARIEAGIPVMGRELDERTIAAEAGLVERAVSFTKGCYTGQELVARLDARGNKVARHLRGLVAVTGEPIPSGGAIVDATGKTVGAVTSSALSPALGAVALGYVHRAVTPPASVTVQAGSGQASASGASVVAEVRELPLVG